MTIKNVGLIGVGLMGHGIGKNILAKGFALNVMAHKKPVEPGFAGSQGSASPAECRLRHGYPLRHRNAASRRSHLRPWPPRTARWPYSPTAPRRSQLAIKIAPTSRARALLCGYADPNPKEAGPESSASWWRGQPTLAKIRPVLIFLSSSVNPAGAAHQLKSSTISFHQPCCHRRRSHHGCRQGGRLDGSVALIAFRRRHVDNV